MSFLVLNEFWSPLWSSIRFCVLKITVSLSCSIFFSTCQTPLTDHFCVIKINVYLLYFSILIQNIKSLPIRVCETSCRSVLQFHQCFCLSWKVVTFSLCYQLIFILKCADFLCSSRGEGSFHWFLNQHRFAFIWTTKTLLEEIANHFSGELFVFYKIWTFYF